MDAAPPTTSSPVQVHLVARPIPGWGLARLVEQAAAPRMVISGLTPGPEGMAADAALPRADVVLLDTDVLHPVDWVEALRRHTAAKILVLTGSSDPALSDQAILSGARGVVRKDDTPETLLQALAKVAQGNMWLDSQAMTRILSQLTGRALAPLTEQARIATLTARERKAIAALASHSSATGKQLAELVHISEHTLRNRLTTIYAKLGLANRVDLFAFAHRHHLHEAASVTGPTGRLLPRQAAPYDQSTASGAQ